MLQTDRSNEGHLLEPPSGAFRLLDLIGKTELYHLRNSSSMSYDRHHEPHHRPRSVDRSGFRDLVFWNLSGHSFSLLQSIAVEKWFRVLTPSFDSMDIAHCRPAICHVQHLWLLSLVLSCLSRLDNVSRRCHRRVFGYLRLERRHYSGKPASFVSLTDLSQSIDGLVSCIIGDLVLVRPVSIMTDSIVEYFLPDISVLDRVLQVDNHSYISHYSMGCYCRLQHSSHWTWS